MKTEIITSGQNPKIKELLALQEKSRTRREKGLFVVEGRRELGHCIGAGFRVRTLFVCREILGEEGLKEILDGIGSRSEQCNVKTSKAEAKADKAAIDKNDGTKPEDTAKSGMNAEKNGLNTEKGGNEPELMIIEVPKALYDKIAYRGGTEGVIAEVEWKERGLKDIRLGEKPLIMVLEAVEKPGNLGAVLRSADAAGADAVIICDPLTDLYNPNLIRASIGAVFSRQVATASSEDTVRWLKENGIKILTAQLQDSEWYYAEDMRGGVAIVMGTEATGLTDFWRKSADAHIKIPMLGQLDSLNVSVSAAILLYEAVRQRNS